MKRIFLIFTVLGLAFTSCKTSQIGGITDDVYASPSEEKKLNQLAAAEKAKKEAEEKQLQENAALAQKKKIDSNPYYQDPSYNQDDYYDYQYASRVRRFNDPVNGLGYYDNYYTNSYWYNQNPACYGTSIYSSYNYLMPSNQFNNYGSGLSMCFTSGNYYGYNNYNNYGYYNPYGYNPYGYNPYNNGFANGYNAGFYNGLYGSNYGYNGYGNNTGWGYFNGYDVNSGYSTYGVRGNNGGSNSPRATTAGMAVPQGADGERGKFYNEIRQKQESTPRFTETPRSNTNFNSGNTNQGSNKVGRGTNSNNTPSNNNTDVINTVPNNNNNQNNSNSGNTKTGNNQPAVNNPSENNMGNTTDPRGNGSSKKVNFNPKNENNYDYNNNSNKSMENNNGNNNNSNNSNNNSSPRGGSGNSTTRPR